MRGCRERCNKAFSLRSAVYKLRGIPLLPARAAFLLPCLALVPVVFFLFTTVLAGQSPIQFNDSSVEQITVSNATFTLVLSKQNGHIVNILERSQNRSLTKGSQGGCLWTASLVRGSQEQYTGGCAYAPSGPHIFRHQWDAASSTLTLYYAGGDPSLPSAAVALAFSDNPYFDMRLVLQNQTEGVVQSVGVPGSLLFSDFDIQSAFLPLLLPGVRLKPEFFRSNRSAAHTYPSQLNFADFTAIEINGSFLSLHTVNPSGPIQPVVGGVLDNDTRQPGTTTSLHSFETQVQPGEGYTSPVVRVRISAKIEDAILAYRADNQIAAYPSVRQKLGSDFDRIARSPLVRADFQLSNQNFTKWIDNLVQLRRPAILYAVSFNQGGHDNNYPDFLPPNPLYGSTADFRRFAEAAKARGFSVMPHTNYTWWNASSPTLRSLSEADRTPLMVQDRAGRPLFEEYGNGQITNGGYVVSPAASSVRSRVLTGWEQWRKEIGLNVLFLDQIGARTWVRDYNPSAASSLGYYDQWLSLLESDPGLSFTTEGGWDRLSKRVWGFLGSALSGQTTRFDATEVRWGVGSPVNTLLGPDTWEPYPLAAWLFHDKALFYQHSLEISSYTSTQEVLTWNALFGLMQIHFWPKTPLAAPDLQWVDVAQAMQRTVSARQAGEPLLAFSYLTPDVVRSTFGTLETVANWNPREPYDLQGNTLVPSGFMSSTPDDTFQAGVFQDRFRSQPLSPGAHTLILERSPTLTTLRHPLGPATPMSLGVPSRWSIGVSLAAFAVDSDNNLIGSLSADIADRTARFNAAPLGNRRPSRYLIQSAGDLVCTDAAAFQMGPVSPGQIVSVFGTDIGPEQPQSSRLDGNGRLTTEAAGIRLLFNGVPAPLLYVSKRQINAIVPYSTEAYDSVVVELEKAGQRMMPLDVPVVNAVPRIFTIDGSGTGQAAALNENARLNSAQNPVRVGMVVALYVTGGGTENVVAADGELAKDASRTLRLPTTVRVGNRDADVLYAGAAPGFAGLIQVNVRIPLLAPRGNSIPVEVRVAGAASQAGVTIAIQ